MPSPTVMKPPNLFPDFALYSVLCFGLTSSSALLRCRVGSIGQHMAPGTNSGAAAESEEDAVVLVVWQPEDEDVSLRVRRLFLPLVDVVSALPTGFIVFQ